MLTEKEKEITKEELRLPATHFNVSFVFKSNGKNEGNAYISLDNTGCYIQVIQNFREPRTLKTSPKVIRHRLTNDKRYEKSHNPSIWLDMDHWIKADRSDKVSTIVLSKQNCLLFKFNFDSQKTRKTF